MEYNITLRSGFSHFFCGDTKRTVANPASSPLSVFHCWEETGIARFFFFLVNRDTTWKKCFGVNSTMAPEAFEMDESAVLHPTPRSGSSLWWAEFQTQRRFRISSYNRFLCRKPRALRLIGASWRCCMLDLICNQERLVATLTQTRYDQ